MRPRAPLLRFSQVSIVLSEQKIKQLNPGDYFGELCLLEGQAPTATVVAETDVITITLDRAGGTRAPPILRASAGSTGRSPSLSKAKRTACLTHPAPITRLR